MIQKPLNGLAQVKAGNTFQKLEIKLDGFFNLCIGKTTKLKSI